MITRYALFEGKVKDGRTEAFRAQSWKTSCRTGRRFPEATRRARHLCRIPRRGRSGNPDDPRDQLSGPRHRRGGIGEPRPSSGKGRNGRGPCPLFRWPDLSSRDFRPTSSRSEPQRLGSRDFPPQQRACIRQTGCCPENDRMDAARGPQTPTVADVAARPAFR